MGAVSPGAEWLAYEPSFSSRRRPNRQRKLRKTRRRGSSTASTAPATETDTDNAPFALESVLSFPLQNNGDIAIPMNNDPPIPAMDSSSAGLLGQFHIVMFGHQRLLPRYQSDLNSSNPMSLRLFLVQLVKITLLVGYTLSAVAPYVRVRSRWITYGFQFANAVMLFCVLPLWGLLNGRLANNKTAPRYLAPYFVWTLLGQGIGHAMAYSCGYYADNSDGWPALFQALQTLVFWWVELFYVQHENGRG